MASGFCVWLTGLSAAGKTTLAMALEARLAADGRPVTMFDGEVVRQSISRDLGFSREDRNKHVRRVAELASHVVADGGIAICALVSPFDEARREARTTIGPERFFLVHVSTPLPVCEARDTDGLYLRARQQEIKYVVGVDEDYEIPSDADAFIDTSLNVVGVQVLLKALARRRLIAPPA